MDRLPTPKVGEWVWWFQGGDKTAVRAALVTQVEDIGRVRLMVQPPSAMPIHKNGVLHASHPQHENPGNYSTRTNGSWNFIGDPEDPPKSSYALADKKIAESELAKLEQERVYREAAENKAKMAKEKAEKVKV